MYQIPCYDCTYYWHATYALGLPTYEMYLNDFYSQRTYLTPLYPCDYYSYMARMHNIMPPQPPPNWGLRQRPLNPSRVAVNPPQQTMRSKSPPLPAPTPIYPENVAAVLEIQSPDPYYDPEQSQVVPIASNELARNGMPVAEQEVPTDSRTTEEDNNLESLIGDQEDYIVRKVLD